MFKKRQEQVIAIYRKSDPKRNYILCSTTPENELMRAIQPHSYVKQLDEKYGYSIASDPHDLAVAVLDPNPSNARQRATELRGNSQEALSLIAKAQCNTEAPSASSKVMDLEGYDPHLRALENHYGIRLDQKTINNFRSCPETSRVCWPYLYDYWLGIEKERADRKEE